MTRTVFEFALEGFDGTTSDTDHLVKWVAARDIEDVREYIKDNNLSLESGPYSIDVKWTDPGVDEVL